ncbi:Phosphodiest-domain-containing protein [Auriscalpium vulgare]|uniref:Phosphodiest-domain-containing protein n=1 Tax=Auriscalpium vulgare TaxID=40419 RepID=A0ACB8S4S9_9AGAM|nr:Phosphodiest-domain-containing protein [Auriscalpium vulgare]
MDDSNRSTRPSQDIPRPSSSPSRHYDQALDEERRGLLSDTNEQFLETYHVAEKALEQRITGRGRLLAQGTAVLLVLLAAYAGSLSYLRSRSVARAKSLQFGGDTLRSNGTHEFKRTVLLASIDGLRADYLERGLTPHLLDISKQGLRAKYMKPIFPTLTFPNHWALMTGLYAESHGIVANNFWDAESDSEFHYNQISSCWNPRWWFGEPMWETAGKAGVINANLMWPGPPKTQSGAAPTYFVPWKNKVSLREKLTQIVDWIDMPLEDRPQLILAYEPSLDQAGHLTGPYSSLVNNTLREVDTFAKDLHSALVQRNLTDIVDVVFVSDHGMTDTSHPELIYIDDILGQEGWASVQHEDGWPSMGLHFSPSANASHYLDVLLAAADESNDKFEVFTPETMPERYHFAHSPRIAPIYVVPKMGYVLTNRKEGDVGLSKGNHGYDNEDPSMHAMFVAHGPFSAVAKAVHQSRAARRLGSRALWNSNKGWHSTNDDTYVMNGFENVEIYNLVMRLLGIESWSAGNNGTKGFWEQYL